MKNLFNVDCQCTPGSEFKCFCSEIKTEDTKIRRRLASCRQYLKNRTKGKNYDNVEEAYTLNKRHSFTLSKYTLTKDFKDLLNISPKKLLIDERRASTNIHTVDVELYTEVENRAPTTNEVETTND